MFNSWGNPYEDDYSWQQLEVGKPAKVKPDVPVTGGRIGTLKSKGDTWMVEFSDGTTMGYDPDMLMKP
jgi:hypothetical protein